MKGTAPMLVSVIIPVYNVAAYLRAALDALRAQTVTDWEALCVDDGSTDGSGALLDDYAARDKRIRVVHQANGGLSAARNAGLSAATGEIILFLDPDDLVASDWMAKLVAAMDGVDLAWGGFVAEVEGRVEPHIPRDVGAVYRGDAVRRRVWRAVFGYRLRDLFKAVLPGGMWRRCGREFAGVWCKAVRRRVLQGCGDEAPPPQVLRFDEHVGLYEDAIFWSECALRAQSMRVVGDTGYRYFIRPTGLMTYEARDRWLRHKFELRDARQRIDPAKTAWRGTYVLSALDILRRTRSLKTFWRYLRFQPCTKV